MPEGVELIMRFHPVGGEHVTVVSTDFLGERQAMEEVARALDERRSLVPATCCAKPRPWTSTNAPHPALRHHRPGRP
jgi:hypothetical protein